MRLLSCVVVVLVFRASLLRAQDLRELVIRPAAAMGPGNSRLQISADGELIAHSVPVMELISRAYEVPENPSPRLTVSPERGAEKRFDLHGYLSPVLRSALRNPARQTQAVQQVLREILRDGFGLVLTEKKELVPVYALSVAPGGPKLTRGADEGCVLDTAARGCHDFAPGFGHPLNAAAVNMNDLSQYLENWTDLPVVNRTGLPGLFTMHSPGWRPMKLPPPPPGMAGTGEEFTRLPSLQGVLASLGLRLQREQATVSFYTVDRLRRPETR